MTSADFVLDVNEIDFEYEVVAFSQNTPVVVVFWAEWSQPSKSLNTLLERLTHEAQGGYRLARINADQNPNLTLRYGVRSLPTVKVFSGGQVVGEFVGSQPEARVREFLAKVEPPSPAALEIEKAEALLLAEQWSPAERIFREALETDPDNPDGLFGLTRALLAQGKSHEGLAILSAFPANRRYGQAQTLRPLAEEMDQMRGHPLDFEADDRGAAFWSAIRLSSHGKIKPALDGLMELLRSNKRDNAARKTVLALFELLGDENPATREYRSELASILF